MSQKCDRFPSLTSEDSKKALKSSSLRIFCIFKHSYMSLLFDLRRPDGFPPNSSVLSLIIYLGRCFTSKYIFPIYSPITPKHINCIPPKKQQMQVMLAHPATECPEICVKNAHKHPIMLIIETKPPNNAIRRRGFMLKLV